MASASDIEIAVDMELIRAFNELERDAAILEDFARTVRAYSLAGGQYGHGEAAVRAGIHVSCGLWNLGLIGLVPMPTHNTHKATE